MAERDVEPWSEIAFQPAGQGQHVSQAWCRTHDIDAMQADLEACFGTLVYFRALAFTPGCGGESYANLLKLIQDRGRFLVRDSGQHKA